MGYRESQILKKVNSKKTFAVVILGLFSFMPSYSQVTFAQCNSFNKKGSVFVHWGYNRSEYTLSNISFKGDNYDFELCDVRATDRPTSFNVNTYLGPTSLTFPQYNISFGYFFKENYSISLNTDHMKYVMVQNQTVKISGIISRSNTEYDGVYDGDDIILKNDFLEYEHTDGLNYGSVELNRHQLLLSSASNNFELGSNIGVGAGAVYPKSRVYLFNEGADEFNLAGYGFSGVVGLQLYLYKWLVLQSRLKGGYLNMPNVVTHGRSAPNRAAQQFWFVEGFITLGVSIPFFDCNHQTSADKE